MSSNYKLSKVYIVVQVERKNVFWRAEIKKSNAILQSHKGAAYNGSDVVCTLREEREAVISKPYSTSCEIPSPLEVGVASNKKIRLAQVAHSRVGDKGNDLNFSIIPHLPEDIDGLRKVITRTWVKDAVSPLLDFSSFPSEQVIEQRNRMMEQVKVEIYDVPGIHSLNVVVRNILDGGVNCSRRIDRHGKTISDLILSQEIIWPPFTADDESS